MGASILAHFSNSDIGRGMAPGNKLSLAAIKVRQGGRPDWWRVGRDFPGVARESWRIAQKLSVSSFRTLIAAKGSLFFGATPVRYRGA